MKIYDCFTFFNELDILDIRLNELYDVVDYFVIVESNVSFRGNPKPFNLEDNWDRYRQFHSKIRYIKVFDMPTKDIPCNFTWYNRYSQIHNLSSESPWTREAYQRDCFSRGLYDMTDDSWIIVSDCDEVLRSSKVKTLRDNYDNPIVKFELSSFYFKLNFISRNSANWIGPLAVRGKDFQSGQHSRRLVREPLYNNTLIYPHSGWHWGYLGDELMLKYKIQNFAHSEHDTPHFLNNLNLDNMIKNHSNMYGSTDYVSVKITDYWPSYITQNPDKWQAYISTDSHMFDIFDIYPKS